MSNKHERVFGYSGKILRVNLSEGKAAIEERPNPEVLKSYIGGAALGIKVVSDEVLPGIGWNHPGNRLFMGSGPLGGTRIAGSGTVAVVTKGALSEGMASSQANGFFGAFLRSCGFDAVVIEGVVPQWSYLHIRDGGAEIRSASHLLGKDTWETQAILLKELGKSERQASVLCIGPAGEKLVRFACICVDRGHMAAHNGMGAVMGSKKLKAIVVERSSHSIPLKDKETIGSIAKELLARLLSNKLAKQTFEEGTLGGMVMGYKLGSLPVRNYTKSVWDVSPDKLERYTASYIRGTFGATPDPCWACQAKHCHLMKIPGVREFEEPEYEGIAAFSSLVGVDDVKTTMHLASEVDRLGMDINESGWVVSWVMECYEKGLLTKNDLDGLEMTWGNGEAILSLLNQIATRQGFGDVLAEGVMRAARRVGEDAAKLAIYTLKGNTPRGHDHRTMWFELFDTCVSNLGTIEAHGMSAPYKLLGLEPSYDLFDPDAVSSTVAKVKGAMVFEDSLVTCRFQTHGQLDLLCQAVAAATGWQFDLGDAMAVGRRAVNLAKVFNLRHGIGPELDAPSERYGSTPVNGPAVGKSIRAHWQRMLRNYYSLMGWDPDTGKPLPETLESLGLTSLVPELWPGLVTRR